MSNGIKRVFRELDDDAYKAGERWGSEIRRGLGKTKVNLEADTAKAEGDLDKAARSRKSTVNADADTGKAEAQLDRVARNRKSTIKVDVDQNSLSRLGQLMGSGYLKDASALSSAGSNLASSLASQAGSIGTTLSAVGESLGKIGGPTAIAGIAAAAVELGGVAASAAQSLWLIPSAIGGVVAAVGTFKLATDGFGDALKNMGDPEKFAKSLQGLAPNAQQAALSIQAMMPAFEQLKKATQDAFFAGVGPQLNALVNQYLPTIQNMTTGIASAFNQMFTGIANQLMTPETQAAVQNITQNITTAFQNLAPAMAPLTKAFADITSVGSNFLPQLAQSATQLAQQFGDFISKAAQSGELQRWLSEGLDTLKQLVPVAFNFAKAFMDLAPVGQAVLPEIASFLSQIGDVMPVISAVSLVIGPSFGVWRTALAEVHNIVTLLAPAFDAIKGVVLGVEAVIQGVAGRVTGYFNTMLQPVRDAIALADSIPGVNIPNIPILTAGSPASSLPTPAAGQPSQGGNANAQRERHGAAPLPAIPTPVLPPANIAPVPAGGYSVPLPPPPKTSSAASAAPAAMRTTGGYTSDSALLAQIPPGTYNPSGDLIKGLGDCSSAVEDLVNIMDGRSTAGRQMSTGNEASWLMAHGFLPTNVPMPGTFQVGFNSSHTQATLPGGTPFNWGSDSAAARRGIGGTGAWDPSFTQHFYRPVAQSYDRTGPTGAQNDPYYMQYPQGYKLPGIDTSQMGKTLGSDLMDLLLPEGFKNPAQFGGVKFGIGLLNGLLGLQLPTDGIKGGDGAALPGGGGGGSGILGQLLSNIPQPFGKLKIGTGADAPGQFMPTMPDYSGGAMPNLPGDVMSSQLDKAGLGGAAREGTPDFSININNPVGKGHFDSMLQSAQYAQNARARQPLRALPTQ
ncbi:hypothetical protein [Mycolicibacterium sp.]|uniref:hypothetical protein n=1 Tax=Mycolicibacterium sp. TaxID=2320850 RepID=UPI0037CCBA1F